MSEKRSALALAKHSRVGIQDKPTATVRNPSDLVGLIACAVGILLVCLMVVYAHNTTEGMAADVRAFAVLLQRILFIPVTVLDIVVILFPTIAVGIDLLVRRFNIVALQGLLAGIGGIIISVIAVFLLNEWGPESLVTGLYVRIEGHETITIPPFISAVTALLTAVATPAKRRSISWSWNLMWISVVIAVVTNSTSLPGMAIALLIGRLAGFAVRYAMGVASRRAYGTVLVDGIHRAGFAPISIDRVSTVRVAETGEMIDGVQTPQFFSDHRLYVMKTVSGNLYNVIVLDGDRQVMNIITRTWRYLRSRAVEGRTTLSLRQTAERTALISYAVRSAGVDTPAVLSISEAADSMIIVREATHSSVSFADLTQDQVTDELLDEMWDQILRAHHCGIAHRGLTPDCFRVCFPDDDAPQVSVLGWETGDVASPDLALRIDLTQMLTLITTKIDPTRALASASRALSEDELASLAPLLQIPAVPKPTRDKMTNPKETLAALRTELVQDLPDANAQPEQITRVGAKTLIITVLVIVALIVGLTSFNIAEVVQALRDSQWQWAVAAFVIGMVGFLGASITFMAFSPVKLSLWKVYVCQVAAAFVALAAPAGLGPAAVNLRVLTKKQVPTPIAAATVALAQVANIVVVFLALVVLTAITGSSQLNTLKVTPAMLITIVVVAVIIGVLMLIPKFRSWILARVTPLLKQTWPRLVELLSSPYRLALGFLGNVLLVFSYVTALLFSVYAFGESIPFLAAAMVYLLGTSAGSVVPTPGGMGAIEVTESATLGSIGINVGIAASIVLLFRLVTYWIRIPMGWFAYRWMRRIGEL